jgi:hypothetical protein
MNKAQSLKKDAEAYRYLQAAALLKIHAAENYGGRILWRDLIMPIDPYVVLTRDEITRALAHHSKVGKRISRREYSRMLKRSGVARRRS